MEILLFLLSVPRRLRDPMAITKKSGAKNDRIDALELADLLRVDRLNPVFHTTPLARR